MLKVLNLDFSTLNVLDGSSMINELTLLGNSNSNLIIAQNKGFRKPNNFKLPHSWSIVDNSELIKWLLKIKTLTANNSHLMKEKMNSKLILLIPAYWACLFDEIITIINQSDEYWNGDLSKANEGNPIGAFMMANHTSGLFIISALWLISIGIIGNKLSNRKLKIFALFVLIAHSFGASTWLSHYYGFWYAIIFILINSIMYIEFENIYETRKKIILIQK